jgi:hypothetical protein
MSATITRLTVVPDTRVQRRTGARARTAPADRWLALQVAIAVVLGVLLAVGATWAVLVTQTLHMSF